MKALRLLALTVLLMIAPAVSVAADATKDRLFQYSTINALLNGFYDGDMPIADLSAEGNFGLGTVNGIDGELIALDGTFYAIRSDGRAHLLASDDETPFAVVTTFSPDRETALPTGVDFPGLEAFLDRLIANANHFQAFRITGHFPAMTVRSEPKQTPPYRPLADVIREEQVVFQLADVEGTLVGFRTPNFVATLNVPGYHFHFITDDRTRGGHVLALTAGSGTIAVDDLDRLELALPDDPAFARMNLGGQRSDDLYTVEKHR